MFGKNKLKKGFVFTLDMLFFLMIILSIIIFYNNYKINNFYNKDLTIKELNYFYNPQNINESKKNNFICRNFKINTITNYYLNYNYKEYNNKICSYYGD